MQECMNQNTTKLEVIEAVKMIAIGGGYITCLNTRYTMQLIKELGIKE